MNGNDEIYRPCHLMTPGSTSMYFLSYIWVDFLNPKRLIKCLKLNIDGTVFRAMVLDYKLKIRNYYEIDSSIIQVICYQWIMLLEPVQLLLQQLCRDIHFSEIIHATICRLNSSLFFGYTLKNDINFPMFHFVFYHIVFNQNIFTFAMHLNSISLIGNLW